MECLKEHPQFNLNRRNIWILLLRPQSSYNRRHVFRKMLTLDSLVRTVTMNNNITIYLRMYYMFMFSVCNVVYLFLKVLCRAFLV